MSLERGYTLMVERGTAHRVVICSADVQLVERYSGLGANAITKPTPIDDLQRLFMGIVPAEESACCIAWNGRGLVMAQWLDVLDMRI
jgi:hypothetical protein